MEDSEAISKVGDVFTVEECGECSGLVIRRYKTLDPGIRTAPSDDVEPTDLIDIPPELFEWFLRRVTELGPRIVQSLSDTD